MTSIDALNEIMSSSTLNERGVSFAGRSLMLNTPQDAFPVVSAIVECGHLEYLNLEGNSLGVEAAKVIGEAISSKKDLTKAFWKDMFTGRLKTEIPIALGHLGRGLMTAQAQLVVLELSDNAMGPIGIDGIVDLLQSSTCFTLEVLRLNNLGLGITGAKKLASAMDGLINACTSSGHNMKLKIFVAGRNRLEDEGAKVLAEVFKKLESLEEIALPQNGIYHSGIEALCSVFRNNLSLKIINLNDNTITHMGALHLKEVLPQLKKLEVFDVGDCLLKSKGALEIASALSSLPSLRRVDMSANELSADAGVAVLHAVNKCSSNVKLNLDSNKFGESCEILKELAAKCSVTLEPLDDDEGDDFDAEDEGTESEQSSGEEYDDEEAEDLDDEDAEYEDYMPEVVLGVESDDECNYQEILEKFKNSGKSFSLLGPENGKRIVSLLKERQYYSDFDRMTDILKTLVVVANLDPGEEDPSLLAETCSIIGKEVINWYSEDEIKFSFVVNTISALLGFVKTEEKCNTRIDTSRTVGVLKTVPFKLSMWDTIDYCIKNPIK